MFEKYAEGRDYLTIWDVSALMKGQRLIADPIGWGGALFECEFVVHLIRMEAIKADTFGQG